MPMSEFLGRSDFQGDRAVLCPDRARCPTASPFQRVSLVRDKAMVNVEPDGPGFRWYVMTFGGLVLGMLTVACVLIAWLAASNLQVQVLGELGTVAASVELVALVFLACYLQDRYDGWQRRRGD